MRIIIERSGAAGVEDRLLISNIKLLHSSLTPIYSDTKDVMVLQKDEFTLDSSFPEVSRQFHPEGSPQKSLYVEWNGVPAGTPWSIHGSPGIIPLRNYRYMSFYLRTGENAVQGTPALALSFTDVAGDGLEFSFEIPVDFGWDKITLDMENGVLTNTRGDLTLSSYTLDSGTTAVDRVAISSTGSVSGSIYLDEIHLHEAKFDLAANVDGSVTIQLDDPVLSVGEFPLVEKVRISQAATLTAKGLSQATPGASITSRTELGAELFRYLGMRSNFVFDWDGLQTSLSGGYEVSIPPVSPNRISDRLQVFSAESGTGFSHASGLFVSLPPVITATFTVEDRADSENLLQEWSGSYSAPVGLPVETSIALTLSQASDAENLPAGTIQDLFNGAYNFILPWAGVVTPERRGTVEALLGFETQVVSLLISPSLTYAVVEEQRLEQSGELQVRLPFHFGQDPLSEVTLELQYLLAFTSINPTFTSATFLEDITGVYETFVSQRYLYTGPIYDLFAQDLLASFEALTESHADSSYKPSFSVSVGRKYGSYLFDLVLPSDFSASFERSVRRRNDTVSQEYTLAVQWRATALNLFGRLGAFQLFGFYDTDEYSTSIGINLALSEDLQLASINPLIQHYLLFFGKGGSELSLENRFELTYRDDITWSEGFSGSYTWRTDVERSFTVPIINIEVENGVYFEHDEALRVDIKGPDFEAEMSYKHTTALILEQFINVNAHITVGVATEESLWLIGLEGGIAARVSF